MSIGRFSRRTREALIAAGALDALFARLDQAITETVCLPMGGQIIDATLGAAPLQRNTEAQKAVIKNSKTAEEIWSEKPAKARREDAEARCTLKFVKGRPDAEGKAQADSTTPVVDYKIHISINRRHGINRRETVTDAATHDGGRWREGLIDPNNTASDVWADSAFRSMESERILAHLGKVIRIHR